MSENVEKTIRVGSRKSELALIQTKHVIARLKDLYPQEKFEIHTMSTIGDRVLNVSLPKIGEKSLFTRDLEDALRNGGVDLVVHSLKDLPTALPAGMTIGAVLQREDSRDALVLNEKFKGKSLSTLPKGSVIGTSSLRRTAQLKRKYPHLEVCDIRGNLNTRLAKLDAATSKFAGIILAHAGLVRMGWTSRISQTLEPEDILYAVGQGALAVECRSNDAKTLRMLRNLMCIETSCKILAERSFLKTLGGGCSAPVAVSTNINGSLINNNEDLVKLQLTGAVWSLDGKVEIVDDIECELNTKGAVLDDEEDESPRKRRKLSEAGDVNGSEPKQSSPKIVSDDENIGSGDASPHSDLQYLIDVHGELFKKCPYFALHQKDKENANSSTKRDECPLKIPVGQDFMGKCPYVDTEQKVELAQANKCPITGNTSEDLKNIKNTLTRDETDKATPKCPFTKTVKPPLDNAKPENCPFLLKNKIKLIDYDLEKPNLTEKAPTIVDDSEHLFCGMFKHACYSLDLFTKCQNVGKQLAENLIKKGALDVMKCAQQEIRDKV